MPRVSVVIPTWNGAALLEDALESLLQQTFRDFETIIVDNGSTDGTEERLSPVYPATRWIRLDENRGFAEAVNIGIRAAVGEIIILMNNDTEADPRWMAALVEALDKHPDVAVCASKMLDYKDRTRIDSAGIQLGLFASGIGQGESDGPRFELSRYVFGACAGGAAYRREAFETVGLFDESFVAYFEDVDLAARLQFTGERCLYVPGAVIYHRGSATSNRIPDTKFYLMMRNSLIVFLRYMPPGRLLWAPAVLAWPFVRAVLDRKSPGLAFRAVRDALRQVPDSLRVRGVLKATRRITWAEFRTRLAGPLARQGREFRVLPRLLASREWRS